MLTLQLHQQHPTAKYHSGSGYLHHSTLSYHDNTETLDAACPLHRSVRNNRMLYKYRSTTDVISVKCLRVVTVLSKILTMRNVVG